MAALRDHKGPTLKKRLDSLEAELKHLQDKIVQRRLKKLNSPSCHPPDISKSTQAKCISKRRAQIPDEDGKDWYSCLKSITRSIAQGSNAIRQIASLTDITSLNGTLSSLMPTTTDQETAEAKPPIVRIPDRELLAYHVNAPMPMKSSSDYSAFERSSVKGVTLSRSDGGISNFLSSSSARPKVQYKGLQECKKNLLKENQRLRKQMEQSEELQVEVNDLKKKLKEETKKRLIAEQKSQAHNREVTPETDDILGNKLKTGYHEKCVGIKEGVPVGEEAVSTPTEEPVLFEVKKITSEELPAESKRSLIEKKYIEEREKRVELEGIVAQFKEDLLAKKKECVQISVGQQLALAMAEQFKAKYENSSKNGSSDEEAYLAKALKETKKECFRLQEELSKVKDSRDSGSDENYKDRALRAEYEVKNLQRRLDQFKNRNPLEASTVKSLLEKHKDAYNELVLAKKCSEAEYKARCRSLEGEVARLHGYYEKRIKSLNTKIKELMVQLQEKMICIDNITSNKDVCDAAQMMKTMSEMSMHARQREAVIGSLNTIIADKEKHAKMIQKEKEEAIEKLKTVQSKMGELQDELEKKGDEIRRLLCELDEKSGEITVKEKILVDQTDTITTLKKSLNETKAEGRGREDLVLEIQHLKGENYRLLTSVNEMAKTIVEAEKFKEGQEKNMHLLHQLENQVYERQKEWDHQISTMSKEKDQAIQTAKSRDEFRQCMSGLGMNNKTMGDSKFSRLDQPDPWKKSEPTPVQKEKSLRLTIDLEATKNYIFSYEELVRKARSKEANNNKNGAPGLPDLMQHDEEEEVKRVALRYEEKYGRDSEKRKYRTYTDLGAGYDSNDSFIDNTEANEEGIPDEMDTKKGGFYVNTGVLEFTKR